MLNQAQKKFVDLLSKVDYSKRLYEVFYDFCTLGTYSLALPFYRDLASVEFKKVSEKYNQDQLAMFDTAFSIMVEDMETSGGDFLGVIYGVCEFGNSRQGQFFTPYNVSMMMAKMTFTGVKDRIQEQGYITVNEPACGSGGMLVAVRQAMIEEGCNPTLLHHVRELGHFINNGAETKPVLCFINYDTPEPGLKTIVRSDTNEIVDTLQMTGEELQGELGIGEDGKLTLPNPPSDGPKDDKDPDE